MIYFLKDLPEMQQYFRDFGLPIPTEIEVDAEELQVAWAETKAQHPEGTEKQQLARAIARLAYKNRKVQRAKTPEADAPAADFSGLQQYLIALCNSLTMPSWERLALWAWRILILVMLWLIFFALPARAQVDVIQFQNAAGGLVKTYAGPFKIKEGANVTFSVDASKRLVITAGAGASTAWDAITNPTTANLSLSMAAFTTTFTWGATTGAGVSLFRLTDTLNNTGTGCILCVDTASGSAAFPFQATALGTANGVRLSTAGLLGAIGTGGINATQYKGGNASGVGTCTNQAVTALNDAAAPTCNTITSAYVDSSVRTGTVGASVGGTGANNTATLGRYLRGDGTNFVTSTVAAAGVGTCTNQFVRATVDNAAPTCATVSLTADVSGVLPEANGGFSQKARLTGDLTSTVVTFADATGLSFSVAANTTYQYEFHLIYQTAATTTGIAFAMNGPASPTSIVGEVLIGVSLTGTSVRYFRAYDSGAASTSIDTANADTHATIRGTFVNGANAGTLIVRFASEVGGSTVTLKAGSNGALTVMP